MVDGFSCILDFPKFSGGAPLIKGIHQLNPQKLSSTITAAKGKKKKKKEPESPPPLKHSISNLSLGYTGTEKGGGRWGKIFFVWFVTGLFKTLICVIAEEKVCDSCIVSSWALLIFLLCLWWPNSNFLCWLCKMENLAVTCFLWLTEKLWLLGARPLRAPPPFKTLITLLPVTFSPWHSSTRKFGVGWGKRLVLW